MTVLSLGRIGGGRLGDVDVGRTDKEARKREEEAKAKAKAKAKAVEPTAHSGRGSGDEGRDGTVETHGGLWWVGLMNNMCLRMCLQLEGI